MALRSTFRNFRGLTKLINQNQELSSKNFRIFCTKATTAPVLNKKEVTVTFVRPNGDRINAKGKVGESLLDVVVNNNIDLDGFGACEGTLTCSTCHLIFKKKDFDQLPDKATEEELDMLDLAYDLTNTSRLGCQIILSEKMDGLEVEVPATINDMRDS